MVVASSWKLSLTVDKLVGRRRAVAVLAAIVLAILAAIALHSDSTESHHAAQVSVGRDYTCVIASSGELECWGENKFAQASPPPGRFSQISAGASHICGITTSSKLECWGINYRGRTDAPAGGFTYVSVGGGTSCAIRIRGELECWGFGKFFEVDPPSGRFSQVSVGTHHGCAIRTSGELECWGYNYDGQADAPSGRFSQVSAGSHHGCAIRTSGELECWGYNYDGQADAPSGRFSQVSAGFAHTCAIRTNGEVECWGENYRGQTDAPSGAFGHLSIGASHACAVANDGELECWGSLKGDLVHPPKGRFSQVSASYPHSCALETSGKLVCWSERFDEWDVPSGSFKQIAVGDLHACAITLSRELVCWNSGLNEWGQAATPTGRYSDISAGSWNYCAIDTAAELECWGRNDNGQADPPSGHFSNVSVGGTHVCAIAHSGELDCWGGYRAEMASAPSGRFTEVSAGWHHTCAIRIGGELECWGLNDLGQLDAPSGRYRHVASGSGSNLTCAISHAGKLECWGDDDLGQANAPSGYFSQVSVSDRHACAITTTGELQCWGYDRMYGSSHANGSAAEESLTDAESRDEPRDEEPEPEPIEASLADERATEDSPTDAESRDDPLSARIAARRLADGRIEFALLPGGERRILPRLRRFPSTPRSSTPRSSNWLNSSTIDYHGQSLGRISARRLADGRTEFSFISTRGERILPEVRVLGPGAASGWKTSSAIEIPLPSCRLGEPIDKGIAFPTRNVTIDGSGRAYRATGVALGWREIEEPVPGPGGATVQSSRYVRNGDDVRYLVCGSDGAPSDEEHDRALFAVGYFYTTEEGQRSVEPIARGYADAQLGFQAHLDHFKQAGLSQFVRQGLQFMQLVVLVNNLHQVAATAGTALEAGVATASVDAWVAAELSQHASELALDLSLKLTQEALDAIRQHPDVIVKHIAWPYVEDARAKGGVWRTAVERARVGEETLTYEQARLCLDWETTIAQGVAGIALNRVLKEMEVKFWQQALAAIPFGIGTALDAIFTLQESGEALNREALNDFDEWLQEYPPYRDLTVPLRAQSLLIARRHDEIFTRLGIDPAHLAAKTFESVLGFDPP